MARKIKVKLTNQEWCALISSSDALTRRPKGFMLKKKNKHRATLKGMTDKVYVQVFESILGE